ncbi:calcineurin-like phosphoesterase family protein [Flavobacteriaceae bacterium MAR_2010_105]|nr:calcineurin-like phosphoesterase family protein [Flavobacteriaceae bacterium MAR_2010_105]
MTKYVLLKFIIVSGLGLFFQGNSFVKTNVFSDYGNPKTADTLDFDDGPYLFIYNDSLVKKTIINGKVETKVLQPEAAKTEFAPENSTFTNVTKIAALSDIHGQYDLLITLLKNNKIIDENLNWAFGNGHFVIVGDIFDRGSEVTEVLWLVYNLEQQALKSGGKVHYILGNHEYMVLQNDLRYIHKKYWQTSKALQTNYDELFNTETLLGRWLRSKPTMVKINDILFVHGGISEEFIAQGFNLEATNEIMRKSLYMDKRDMQWDSIYGGYFDSNGPIWYRGYFSEDFKKACLNKLLRKLDVKHIVVGHTSQTQVKSLFNNKLFAVDSSIKNGSYGEILIVENKTYYRGTLEGEKIQLD